MYECFSKLKLDFIHYTPQQTKHYLTRTRRPLPTALSCYSPFSFKLRYSVTNMYEYMRTFQLENTIPTYKVIVRYLNG